MILDVNVGSRPQIIYWGKPLLDSTPEEIQRLSVRQWARGGPHVPIPYSLSNEFGGGMASPAGFRAHRDGQDWATIFRVTEIQYLSDHRVRVVCTDSNTKLRATYDLSLDPLSHVVVASTAIRNLAPEPVSIDWCAALCVPLSYPMERLIGFTGRCQDEFVEQEIVAFRGSYVRENKTGRTSHDSFPGLISLTQSTNEQAGAAAAFHLGWSGNHIVRADQNDDGQSFVQMGELLYPNEMVLQQDETYTTPSLYASWSESGVSQLSRQMHAYLTDNILDGRAFTKPRPVHFNTWDAVYFDHSDEKLTALAETAASVGAERFILDDGWFGDRRHDRAGLGDWYVSKDVYPNGLTALANRVRALGMEFGIWFEPEMINPDSNLYRQHPEWVLEVEGLDQVPFRGQYALDCTRTEVTDYLFDRMSAVIAECYASYIKWDMNRDIHHPGSDGKGAIHAQTMAVYALMKRLREAHPNLEIETCSAGGARADYGILQYADRVWPSDNQDALERQRIQRGASYFLPLRILGTHVGPRTCPMTGRQFSMAFRAATAMFGHMGMELDLTKETESDLLVLKDAITLHKKHRELLHSGTFNRLDGPDYLNTIGVISKDKKDALYSCAKTATHHTTTPIRLRFTGIDPEKRYRLRLVWPFGNVSGTSVSTTSPSIIDSADLFGEGGRFMGEALLAHGIQLPIMHPETCLIYHLDAD
jgi:alpha-galactosidase